MPHPTFPPGWDAARVQKVLAHYEGQTEDEAMAEDEAAFIDTTQTVREVPHEKEEGDGVNSHPVCI